jgi:hypothetical protein
MKEKLEAFRALLQAERLRGIIEQGYNPEVHPHLCRVKVGRKYANIDTDGPHSWSGRYMVDLATGEIFGIKGYGVIHRGHRFGTLDTLDAYDWSGYRAVPKQAAAV